MAHKHWATVKAVALLEQKYIGDKSIISLLAEKALSSIELKEGKMYFTMQNEEVYFAPIQHKEARQIADALCDILKHDVDKFSEKAVGEGGPFNDKKIVEEINKKFQVQEDFEYDFISSSSGFGSKKQQTAKIERSRDNSVLVSSNAMIEVNKASIG